MRRVLAARNVKALDLAQRDPPVVEVPGRRADALRLFVEHAISGVCVVAAGTRELAGVVTRTDMLAKPGEDDLARLISHEPFLVSRDAEAIEAARLFHHHRVHMLPVVDGRRLVGVLDPTDLLGVTRATGPVQRFVTQHVVPVHEGTPLAVVWATMRLTGHNALPVVDDDARLAGIIADSDLFRLAGVEESIAFYDQRSADGLPRRAARDAMVRDVLTVTASASAQEAAQKMAKARVNQLPVLDARGALVGIVTDLDLMRAWFP